MLYKRRRLPAITVFALALVTLFSNYAYAQEKWFSALLDVREQYDDNVYLTDTDRREDWITTVSPAVVIEPHLAKHKAMIDYRGAFKFFSTYKQENNYNHISNAAVELLFNKIRFKLDNMFHYFSDRLGAEDVDRIPRTQDYAGGAITFDLNKMDLSLGFKYKFEGYRSDRPIGAFRGRALTYEDLVRNEYEGEVEGAFKLWPKTMLLFSGDYGTIRHKTGRKSDSCYFDALTGLRGELTAKSVVEAKVGYRQQNYEDPSEIFRSVFFKGGLIENFTSRDVLRLDFLRTTNDTIYRNNAYFVSTFFAAAFKHGFTDRFFGDVDVTFQRDNYPTETTEATETAKRKDDIWTGGIGVSYELVEWFAADLRYEYKNRSSKFSTFDYTDNTVSVGVTGTF